MPVFVRSGGIVVTRSGDVSNDAQHPLTAATVTVNAGADGRAVLQEDGTELSYRQGRRTETLHIGASRRAWTIKITNADQPRGVRVNGHALTGWTYSAESRTVTITLPQRPARVPVTVTVT
jgi:hypothetical protein